MAMREALGPTFCLRVILLVVSDVRDKVGIVFLVALRIWRRRRGTVALVHLQRVGMREEWVRFLRYTP
jgi:hypothetical protein